MTAYELLGSLKTSDKSMVDINSLSIKFKAAMNDDFNTPVLIAELFDATKIINSIHDGKTSISESDLNALKELLNGYLTQVLGLKNDLQATDDLSPLMDFILNIRTEAKANKDYLTSDKIRIGLNNLGFEIKDGKEGSTWSKN